MESRVPELCKGQEVFPPQESGNYRNVGCVYIWMNKTSGWKQQHAIRSSINFPIAALPCNVLFLRNLLKKMAPHCKGKKCSDATKRNEITKRSRGFLLKDSREMRRRISLFFFFAVIKILVLLEHRYPFCELGPCPVAAHLEIYKIRRAAHAAIRCARVVKWYWPALRASFSL